MPDNVLKKGFTVIQETESYITTLGFFYDYYAAIGKAVCSVSDEDDERKEAKCEITEKEDFYELELEDGYGWYRVYEYTNLPSKQKHKVEWFVVETEINPKPGLKFEGDEE